MPAPTNAAQHNRLRRFVLGAFLILGLLLTALTVWRVQLQFRINAQINAIRRAGLPASGPELNAYLPQIPDAANGALALTKAFTNFYGVAFPSNEDFAALTNIKPSDSWGPEVRAYAERYLQTNKQALAQIESALNRYTQFRYPADYSRGPDTPIPHLRHLKRSAQILRIRTMLEAQDKNPAWTNTLLLQLKLARTLESEPSLFGFLVRVAMLRIASSSAEYALHHSSPDAAACRLLQNAFFAAAQTNTLPLALISDRAINLRSFDLGRAGMQQILRRSGIGEDDDREPVDTPIFGHTPNPLWAIGFFERDRLFFLTTMSNAIALSRAGAPANLQLTNIFDVAATARRRVYIISGMLLPALSKLAYTSAEVQALAKVTGAAFAVEAHRQTQNHLPDTLQEIVPAFLQTIPIDPFDAQPIHYRKLDQGYAVYSVDIDRLDDHAKRRADRRRPGDTNTYDISFSVLKAQ